MQRLKFWIGGALAALVSTGIAVAATGGASTETPAATFAATAKKVQTRTCEGSDGTYRITRGVYAGEMESSDPRLDGQLRIRVHSVYNVDEKAGWLRGTVHVRNESEQTKAAGRLVAVNLDGTIEGMISGRAGTPRARLLANVVASFGEGFTNGKLGSGASTNQALLFRPGCQKADADGDDEQSLEERKAKRQKQLEERKAERQKQLEEREAKREAARGSRP